MANFGKTILIENSLDYLEYHGHKRSVKQWVIGLGDSWEDCFDNIPFGALKMSGYKLKPGFIIRIEKNKYIFETKEAFNKKYYKF